MSLRRPSGRTSFSPDNTVRLWNTRTLVCVAAFGGERGHREQVLTAAFNDTGTQFVSAGMDHYLKVWNLENPRLKEVGFQAAGALHAGRTQPAIVTPTLIMFLHCSG